MATGRKEGRIRSWLEGKNVHSFWSSCIHTGGGVRGVEEEEEELVRTGGGLLSPSHEDRTFTRLKQQQQQSCPDKEINTQS